MERTSGLQRTYGKGPRNEGDFLPKNSTALWLRWKVYLKLWIFALHSHLLRYIPGYGRRRSSPWYNRTSAGRRPVQGLCQTVPFCRDKTASVFKLYFMHFEDRYIKRRLRNAAAHQPVPIRAVQIRRFFPLSFEAQPCRHRHRGNDG